MNVLLVSQCSKQALVESRRILDQFAERKGDRTWQTPITMEGLDTLRRLLRKKARKNTAVACHWIRGKDHSELMWVVGDAKRFSSQGTVPTNTTASDVLRQSDEDDWHTGEEVRLLTGLAALLHDLGKACRAFQERLKSAPVERNLYRHEWISLRLFQAFVGNDDDKGWLARLADSENQNEEQWLSRLERDGLDQPVSRPLEVLPPLAKAIGWLVLSHHRMPLMPSREEHGEQRPLGAKVEGFRASQLLETPDIVDPAWNECVQNVSRQKVEPYWEFPRGLPVALTSWREKAVRYARLILERPGMLDNNWLHNPYVMHLSRMSLMLADHYYSSQTEPAKRIRGEAGYSLYANTTSSGAFNQTLDEHILGVRKHGEAIVRSLPSLNRHLPRLARHKGFRKRSKNTRFRWQDKAFDLAEGVRRSSEEKGFFGVNMASTGCGKTLANGRIMYALAHPQKGARFTIALGLRTLTLQTGQAYRDLLQLGADDLAVRVGGAASRELFEHNNAQAAATGSESSQSLMPESSYVHYEGNFEGHPLLRRTMHNPLIERLIAAPILTCTIDHLVPATESARGGGQIAPMMRLMSSDLILDEPDDFDLNDMPALSRLVHWCGLLGSRVLLSSATLPPALIEGLFDAYRAGREQFQRNRGRPGDAVNICCAWFDEADRKHADCPDREVFRQAHEHFARRRHERLKKAPVRRRGDIVPVAFHGRRKRQELCGELAELMLNQALELHAEHNTVDASSGRKVSFGLIRMANIEPLIEVARYLFTRGCDSDHRIHLCVYHSQHPLLIRSSIEKQLDQALDRRDPEAVFDIPEIRQRLAECTEDNQIFIVLGSPVTEVGRDHDYDWAVVEPSSMRSLIQLAGRVRRHRVEECSTPNVKVLDTNLKHLESPEDPAFRRPGFEGTGLWLLNTHRISELMDESECRVIDSRPRILQRHPLAPNDSLVDLEHARLQSLMVMQEAETQPVADDEALTARQRKKRKQKKAAPLGAYTWWSMPQATLTAVLPQHQRFRESSGEEDELVLMPDDSGEDYELMRVHSERGKKKDVLVSVEALNHRVDFQELEGPRIQPWGTCDYMSALAELADGLGMELDDCAQKFGTVTLRRSEQGWEYHPVLGFSKKR